MAFLEHVKDAANLDMPSIFLALFLILAPGVIGVSVLLQLCIG
jgi:hypothetical protein